jgi:hypothetical protein
LLASGIVRRNRLTADEVYGEFDGR